MPIRRSTRSNRGVKPALEESSSIEETTKRKNELPVPKSGAKRMKSDKLKHDPKLTEEEEVRCLPCGLWSGNYNEEEEFDSKFDNWIECSRCKLWQHTFCMFGTANAKVPSDYQCDICDPNNKRYDHLKRKMGYDRWLKLRFPDGQYGSIEDPLEEDLDAFEAAEEDDNDSDANIEEEEDDVNISEDDVDGDEEIMAEEDDDDDDAVIVRPKAMRKAEVFKENRPKRAVVTKKKSVSGPIKKPTITNSLKAKRDGIIKGFSIVIKKLIPQDDIELLKGKTIDELTNDWSSELESIIFDLFGSSDTQYTNKCRSFLQNIKGNHLIERVISGEFDIKQLPKLTNEEMKTKEEKERDQKIREKELSKHVIKTSINTVPQVKITHKGEEVLENADYQFDDPTSSYVNDKRLEEVEEIRDKLKEKKREEEAGDNQRHGSIIEDQSLRNVFHAHAAGFDEYEDNMREEEEEDQQNDQLQEENGVDGNVDDEDDDDEFDNIINGTSNNNQVAETEIESPPAKVDTEFTEVWNGSTELGFGPFESQVTYITSNDPKGDLSKANKIFEDLIKIKGKISLDGRLNDKVANQYLTKIGQTRFFYLYEIQGQSNDGMFSKSWKFYNDKRKYGVIGQKPGYVKDIYLISNSKDGLIDNRPEFFGKFDFELINDSIMNGEVNEKMYLLFVVSKGVEFNEIQDDEEEEEGDDYEPSTTPPVAASVAATVTAPTNTLPDDAQIQLQNILNSLKG